MAKKKLFKNMPDWATIIFWIVCISALIAILTGAIIWIVKSLRDIDDLPDVTTTTTTQVDFPEFTGIDPGNAVGAQEIPHVSMDEIIWDRTDTTFIATPAIEYQIGNERMRDGNTFFKKVEPGLYPELNLLTSVIGEYDYVDPDGLGRSFTYSGMYAWNAQDNYLIAGDEENLGKRYLVILEDGTGFTVLVDRTEAEGETKSVSNVKYVYEIDDGYTPEQYPATDGNGNLI